MEIIAEPFKRLFVNRPFQPETRSTFASPRTDQFLALAVVVRRAVILLGGSGIVLLGDADHA